MAGDSDDSTRRMLHVVPSGRGPAGVPHADETRMVCLVIYATGANRSPSRTEKLARPILEDLGLPVPLPQTIADWARDENWQERADNLWRANPDLLVQELQRTWAAIMLVASRGFLDMLTGNDTRTIDERILTTKQVEIAMRVPRDLPALARYEPPEREVDTTELPREEREALARQALVPRRKVRAGR